MAASGSPGQAEMLLSRPCDRQWKAEVSPGGSEDPALLTKVILIPAVSVAASGRDGDGVELAVLSLT